jgi:RimJ/RimL family protein N-acetyltransferase
MREDPFMIRAVRASVAAMDAALAGDEALARVLGHDVAPGWATFREALQPTRDALALRPSGFAWGTRFFVTDEPHELVGWGGFKGAPKDGVVELGYEIAEGRRGRGLATEVTRAMVAEAFADPEVTAVVAHTLPERNASNRVLEKVGFRFETSGEEDGETVWRFVLDRGTTAGCA